MKKLLSVREVADVLSVSTKTIYRLASHDQLPYVRIGKAIRFDIDRIEAFVREQQNESLRMR